MGLIRDQDFLDFDFVAAEEPGVGAAAVRTGLAVGDGGVILPAAVAVGDRRDGVDAEFAAPEKRFLVSSPTPAIGEVSGDDGGHLADVHHHRRDLLNAVGFGCLLDVADNIEDDSQFVHLIQLRVKNM